MAVVGPDGKVSLHAVTVGQDNGKDLEILSGLDAGDQVITNPPDAIADGDVVRALAK